MSDQRPGSEVPRGFGAPVAWVAGASRGLGLALARELGLAGYRVVITARTAADLERARELLQADGVSVRTIVHDVRDPVAARDVVAEVEATWGSIDTVIAVAGLMKVGPLPQRAEDYDQSIDIMLRGPINVVHAVLPSMQVRGDGRIGIVTSIAGLIPVPHLVPYTAAKFGALGFSRGLTEELRGSGISVSTIIPGLMRTGGHWHADYSGQPGNEYAWFTALSALPVISIEADRAAKIIVGGVLRGRSKIIFTLPALAGDLLYRLSPEAVGLLLGWAGRLLPGPGDDQQPGFRAARGVTSDAFTRITGPARRAVRRWNQQGAHQSGGDASGS
ncbi:SDR family NAD(P)-dependent oxidoreductase [Microlunatus elymi]|nr:SDR family oxidoreductase [Microlunatus elymi]